MPYYRFAYIAAELYKHMLDSVLQKYCDVIANFKIRHLLAPSHSNLGMV